VVDGTEPVRDDPLGRRAPLLRPLPTTVHEDQVDTSGAEATGTGFLLGVAARRSRPLLLPLLEPGAHLLVYGDRGSGRSTLLSRAARWYASRPTAGQVRLHLVHPRRSLLDLVALPGVAAHAVTPAEVDRLVGGLVDQLRYAADRQPTQHVLVVDDADLIASFEPLMAGTPSALEPLVTFVPAAAEVGLHVLLARRVAGVARSAYDPVLARLRENAAAVLVLSGDRSEGPVVGGVSAQPMLPGRGRLVRPYGGPPDGELVQCALPRPAGG
jgi:S-DNA-T family DNA segregation ATPase FtsK/SpoIIIE